MVVRRFDVLLVDLEPTKGREIQKTRPCLVVSPDSLNLKIATFIVAPLTTKGKRYPSRVPCYFQGQHGFIVLDQLRTVDLVRVKSKLGRIANTTARQVLDALKQMFAP